MIIYIYSVYIIYIYMYYIYVIYKTFVIINYIVTIFNPINYIVIDQPSCGDVILYLAVDTLLHLVTIYPLVN